MNYLEYVWRAKFLGRRAAAAAAAAGEFLNNEDTFEGHGVLYDDCIKNYVVLAQHCNMVTNERRICHRKTTQRSVLAENLVALMLD